MLSSASNFVAVLGGIGASLLWFAASKQSFPDRDRAVPLSWRSVAVIIILIDLAWAIAWKEWLGSALAIGVMCFEVWAIKQGLKKRHRAGTG